MDETSPHERLLQIDGAMPRLTAIYCGCAFHPRGPQWHSVDATSKRPELIARAWTQAAAGCTRPT